MWAVGRGGLARPRAARAGPGGRAVAPSQVVDGLCEWVLDSFLTPRGARRPARCRGAGRWQRGAGPLPCVQQVCRMAQVDSRRSLALSNLLPLPLLLLGAATSQHSAAPSAAGKPHSLQCCLQAERAAAESSTRSPLARPMPPPTRREHCSGDAAAGGFVSLHCRNTASAATPSRTYAWHTAPLQSTRGLLRQDAQPSVRTARTVGMQGRVLGTCAQHRRRGASLTSIASP